MQDKNKILSDLAILAAIVLALIFFGIFATTPRIKEISNYKSYNFPGTAPVSGWEIR